MIKFKDHNEKRKKSKLLKRILKICSFVKQIVTYKGSIISKFKYLIRRIKKYLRKRRNKKNKNKTVIKEKSSKKKNEIDFKVIFFCEANYHIRNASKTMRLLKQEGIDSCIIDFTKFLGEGKRQLNKEEKQLYEDIRFFEYNQETYSSIDLNKLKLAVFFNDWGINNKFIRQLRNRNIITVGIDEGVNDFLKLGEGFTSKVSPYRTCEYVILPGRFDTQFFKDRPDQYFVSGLPMIRKLYKEEVTFPKKPLAVINVNFTYGVLTWYRNLFVKTAIEGCKLAGIDYVITQHPMDNADLSEYDVTDKNMYDTIRGGSIFISRFSGAIIEALAMGKPCVYHNPHNEKMIKFQKPMGGYSISDSAQSLAKAIKYELDRSSKTPVREYSRKFMEYHANIGEKKEPAELITETIIKLMKS
jgi:hypothetical protein